MSSSVETAMVLTAGLGTRLHPITHKIPKPLVSILNIPNILHVLFLLKKSGVSNVVMNLFHLSEEMESFFKKKRFFNLNYTFTYENPILGTGGGVKNAAHLFGEKTFVLANCDFVSNIDIKKFILKHFEKKAKASMVLIQDETRQHLYSKVGVNDRELLVSLPKLQTRQVHQHGIFTGIHILDPEVLNHIEAKPCGINDTLYPYLMKNHPESVCGFIEPSAFWYDTGDIPAFLETSHKLLLQLSQKDPFLLEVFAALGLELKELGPGIWSNSELTLDPKRITGPALIGENVQFGKGVSVGPFTVIGDHSRIDDLASIENSVILPKSWVKSGSRLNQTLFFEPL